ncbi:MAG: AarF/ABC1/UbiB kinase family protein [Candidatus Sericytochromatia bacterium]|nr:AarF/ABC1/UbiB kinase family protein [Candidatus Sericytochromatia bacterium]
MPVFNPISAVNDINRFRQIVAVLFSHGFGQLVDQILTADTPFANLISKLRREEHNTPQENITLARRALLVLQDLGPTFIKLGQILSTRADLIPDEFIQEFKTLQDDVPAFSFNEARILIETELGGSIEDIYKSFNQNQLATASIGQVYTAVLKTGEEVVVKVQRPNVGITIERDIDLLYILARLAERQSPDLKLLNPVGIVKEFEKAIQRELDYNTELRNALRFAEAFKYHDQVIIPKVYKEYSSKKVFTMEKINGVKITSAELVGSDKKVLAKVALQAILHMVFENGFFHADPHPGNLFALPDNKIAILDLGMVGRLDEEMRDKMAELVIALNTRNTEGVARSLYKLGKTEEKIDFSEFKRDVGDVLDKILGLPISEIKFSEIINDLIQGAKKNRISIPNDYTLMGKAILTIEGIGRMLDPQLDLEAEAEPFVRKLIRERYSPKRIGEDLYKRGSQFYQWSYDVPVQMVSILEDIQNGNIKLKTEDTNQALSLKIWEQIIGKLTAGFITSALIISSTIFLIETKESFTFNGLPLKFVLGLVYMAFALFLGLNIIRNIKFKKSD